MSRFPRSGRLFAALLAVAVAAALVPAGAAPYRVSTEGWLRVEARPVLVLHDGTAIDLETIRADVPPGGSAGAEIVLGPGAPDGAPGSLAVEFRGSPGTGERPHRVGCRAGFVRRDGTPVRAERELDVRDGGAAFFEAGHGPGWRLTLVIRAERIERPVVALPSPAGKAVLFRVDVGRVRAGEFLLLETNDLSTFESEPVEYMFRLGRGESLEHVRLVLTPARLEADLVEIRVDLSGTIHAGLDSPLLLSRRDTLFTDRGTTSEIAATFGDPPDGFAFRITPVW